MFEWIGKDKEYIITKKIGEGGMGEVWRGWKIGAEGFRRLVAIKRIKEELLERQKIKEMFKNEAYTTMRLIDHDNIVKVIEFTQYEGQYLLIMEYVKGVTLRDFVKKTFEKLSIPVSFFIVQKTLEALQYIHQIRGPSGELLGLVHKDVNPKNILISTEGGVKLTDFGIAFKIKDVFGKIQYMPPEVLTKGEWSPKGDIFCAGLVLYELLTGEQALKGDTKEIQKKISKGDFPPPSSKNPYINETIDSVVMKSLSKDPLMRYETPQDFSVELDSTLDKLGYTKIGSDSLKSLLYEGFVKKIEEEEQELRKEEVKISAELSVRRKEKIDKETGSERVTTKKGKEKRRKEKVKNSMFITSTLLGVFIGIFLGVLKSSFDAKKITENIKSAKVMLSQGEMKGTAMSYEEIFHIFGSKRAARISAVIYSRTGECQKAQNLIKKAKIDINLNCNPK